MLGCAIEQSHSPAFLLYNKEKPPSASLTNKPLGGAKMHSHCINKLLNIEEVIVKKLFMAILL